MTDPERASDTDNKPTDFEQEGYSLAEAKKELGDQITSATYLKAHFAIPEGVTNDDEMMEYHKRDHFGRVLVLAVPMFTALRKKGVQVTTDYDFETVGWFAVLHDLLLRYGNYAEHGTLGAYYVMDGTNRVPEGLRQEVALAIHNHVPHNSKDQKEGLSHLHRICKDLDSLDRVRLSGDQKLNPKYLRVDVSHSLIPIAKQLYDRSQELIEFGMDPFDAALEAAVQLEILTP